MFHQPILTAHLSIVLTSLSWIDNVILKEIWIVLLDMVSSTAVHLIP